MNSRTKDMSVLIQNWIYCLGESGKLKVFIGTEAQYSSKQKLYSEGWMDHKFVAESVPGLADAHQGDWYKVRVKEEADPQYGYQYRIVSAERIESAEAHEIRVFMLQMKEKHLTSNRIDALINAYDAKVLEAILTNPASLDLIKAKPDIKRQIHYAIAENSGYAALMAFLAKRKWDCSWGRPLYEWYGDKAIFTLRMSPYLLYERELTGFKAADRVFLDDGGNIHSPLRCRRAVMAALRREEKYGGVYVPRKELRGRITPLLGDADPDKPSHCSVSEDDISKALDMLEESRQIHIDRANGRKDVYLLPLYQAEVRVAER